MKAEWEGDKTTVDKCANNDSPSTQPEEREGREEGAPKMAAVRAWKQAGGKLWKSSDIWALRMGQDQRREETIIETAGLQCHS
jgi:hypothetical protein